MTRPSLKRIVFSPDNLPLARWMSKTPRASVQVYWTDALISKGFPFVQNRGYYGAANDVLAYYLQNYGKSGQYGENPDARYIDATYVQVRVNPGTNFMFGKRAPNSEDFVSFDPEFLRSSEVGIRWAWQEALRMADYKTRVSQIMSSSTAYVTPKSVRARLEKCKDLSNKYGYDWVFFTAIANAFAIDATADEKVKSKIRHFMDVADEAKKVLESEIHDAETYLAEIERDEREKRERQEIKIRIRKARMASGQIDEESLDAFVRLGGKYADRVCNTRAQKPLPISVESDGKVFEQFDKNGFVLKIKPAISTYPEKMVSDGRIAFPCKNTPPNAYDVSEDIKSIVRAILDEPVTMKLVFVPEFESWSGKAEILSSGDFDTSNVYAILRSENKIESRFNPVLLGAVLSRVGDVIRFEQRENAPLTAVLITGKKGVGIIMPVGDV